MITPINIQEYMSIIARKYQHMPEGKEKDDLWLEIKQIADRQYPSIQIDDISDNEVNYSNDNNNT